MMLKPVTVDRSETIYSVISRLAAINGSGNARALVRHLGISRMGFDSSIDAFEKLSAYSGIPVDTLSHASYQRHHKKRIRMGGSVVARSTVSNQAPRFCALCVMDDMEQRTGRPIVRPFQRFSWTVTDVVACHKHFVALDHASGPPALCHEFVLAVSERTSMIEVKASRAERLDISPADLYFAGRLDGYARPVPDLDALPYFVAQVLCERLGVIDLMGVNAPLPKADYDLIRARARGFDLVVNTPGGLREHLTELTKAYWKPHRSEGVRCLFGGLYGYFAHHMDDDHKGLIDLLTEVVTENIPVGPPDNFLSGLKSRRWHSVITFSREYGLTPQRAAGILRREGFIPSQSGFDRDTYSNLVFDAEMVSPYFPRQELIDRMALARRMKLLRFRHTAIFAKEGPFALRRHADDAGVYRLYSISETEELLARLVRNAGNAIPPDMCRVREAARRALCTVDEVLDLLVEGKLQHVSFKPDELFEGILVSVDELRTKTKVPYVGWVHSDEVARRLDIKHNDAADLMRKGTLRSEHVNYRFGTAILTTKESVDEFDRRYVSVSALAKKKGKPPAEVVRKFGKAGVHPAIRSSCGRSLFFYRHDLDP